MISKNEIHEMSKSLGLTSIGITSDDRLKDLPIGNVLDVANLQAVQDILPSAKSVIIVAYDVWDPIFNVVACGPKWIRPGVLREKEGYEFYQLYSQVLESKAWALAFFLQKKGFESTVTRKIALKPAAIQAGLGCRGKNTLVVSPQHGSRVRFAAVITTAKLDPDEPYTKDLCGDCIRCLESCPTKALKPYEIDIRRCLTYAAENHESLTVDRDVRQLEKKLIRKPSLNSFIECTICQDACPIGSTKN